MKRTITFGKYKGQYIVDLILTHIGYIMWCLDNIPWFSLDDEEQQIYDYVSIAALKSRCEWSFPVEGLSRHIKDRQALERRYTPFSISANGIVSCTGNFTSPLLEKHAVRGSSGLYDLLSGMAHTLNKFEPLGEDDCLSYGDFE